MSELLDRIQRLVGSGELRISEHGYDELAEDGILAGDVIKGLRGAVVVEEYPAFAKGPAVLVLEYDAEGRAIHAVWGIPKGLEAPAVLVTAYRPDPEQWDSSFTERKK